MSIDESPNNCSESNKMCIPRTSSHYSIIIKAFYESKGHIHKRAASYTIIKNRGLIPHKNKANRNPR